jgi:hypothetical protein
LYIILLSTLLGRTMTLRERFEEVLREIAEEVAIEVEKVLKEEEVEQVEEVLI